MKTILALAILASVANGQALSNWNTYASDPQRSGWERNDPAISKDTVKDFQLLWKMKLETQAKGLQPILPPLITGRLISYKGFKELAFVGTNSDIVYAIDADLGKMFWQKHLEYNAVEPPAPASSPCHGGLSAMPTMPPPLARGGRGAPAPQPAPAGRSAFLGAGPASVYAISSDGRLHRLNSSTGDDMVMPVSVLPPNSWTASLNMNDNVIYAVSDTCPVIQSSISSIDLNADPPAVKSIMLGIGAGGLGGPVVGTDGTIYAQRYFSPTDPGHWGLVALSPKDLNIKQEFGSIRVLNGSPDLGTPTPVVFPYKGRDLIVTGDGGDGRLFLLDSTALGGANRLTPLFSTPPLVKGVGGAWGSLSSWEDSSGTRWVLVPVWGTLNPELKIPLSNGAAPGGSILAFKVEEQSGKLTLTPAWSSREMNSPLPPVIASGVVFAVSAGEFTGLDRRPKNGTRATLYALDAATGKEIYSSKNLVNGPASLAGITVANGRVYFGTLDGTLYEFGVFVEH